jgi:hypothetical protein
MLNITILITLFYAAIITNFLFYSDKFISIEIAIAIMVATLIFSLRQSLVPKKLGIILISLAAFYAPFTSLFSYLGFDWDYRHVMFGLHPNPYTFDQRIIELTATIGATGSMGSLLGITMSKILNLKNSSKDVSVTKDRNSLSVLNFILWIIAGLILSILSAPSETIFTAAYTNSLSILHNANFSSSWMVAFCIVLFAYSDYRFERVSKRSMTKGIIFWAVLFYIVVVNQLLRGDRESLTLIVGMMVAEICYLSTSPIKNYLIKNKLVIIIIVCLLLLVSNFVGVFRSAFVLVDDIDSFLAIANNLNDHGMFDISRFFQGTWNAVFLGPMSVAGDYLNQSLNINYGKDYLDLFKSLPPGFIADFFGYVRPWSNDSNPAWGITYGIGGWYFLVLPFMNFLLFGVFILSAIIFMLLAWTDHKLQQYQSATKFAFYLIILMAIPHWFWYGEKAIINAIITFYFLSIIYKRITTVSSIKIINTYK